MGIERIGKIWTVNRLSIIFSDPMNTVFEVLAFIKTIETIGNGLESFLRKCLEIGIEKRWGGESDVLWEKVCRTLDRKFSLSYNEDRNFRGIREILPNKM